MVAGGETHVEAEQVSSRASSPGSPRPLGATPDEGGTNFAVFSEHAEAVTLCLFDGPDETRIPLRRTGNIWHAYVPDLSAGTRYGFRAHGEWNPSRSRRFNVSNLLLDPYSRAIEGEVRWHDALFGDDPRDTAPFMPRCVVVDGAFDWGDDRPPRAPLSESVIYEAHLKGMTKLHPDVDPELRGTWAGLAHPAAVRHLVDLGVTAVELLPVQHHIHDEVLVRRGLSNYWGYQPIGYFAPHPEYASTADPEGGIRELKSMVRTLHAAGIEVLIDVVYNHTGEWDETGPSLSFRGLDDEVYYRHPADDPSRYVNYTGVGNTFNVRHRAVLQLVMDSLRYWVTEMHVDGFRFDLATTLGRGEQLFDAHSAFLAAVQQDPVLSGVKLIAEPWDLGPDSYQLGSFPPVFAEWNGSYRDHVRDFWRSEEHGVAELARRLTGSSDLFGWSGRTPEASVNFVTSHDGFPLRDLVTYERKRNLANGEDNRDGESHNRSWNCGVEGPTDDPVVNALRQRQQRNLIATLLLSQGVPMVLGGDEIGRTQQGNNNAYCHDTELSWFDWSDVDDDLLAWTRRLIALRRAQPVLRHRHFLKGEPDEGSTLPDVAWFTSSGSEMTVDDWHNTDVRTLGMRLDGEALDEIERLTAPAGADTLYVMFNGRRDDVTFTLPDASWGTSWVTLADSAAVDAPERPHDAGAGYRMVALSVVVLRLAR